MGTIGPIEKLPGARHHVDRHGGEQQVELAAIHLALGVVEPATPVLRRPSGSRTWAAPPRIRAGRHVDRLREARVSNGAVVALEVVLDADLPVGVVLGVGPLMELERVDVDAAIGDHPRQIAEVIGERAGAGQVDEDERPPRVDRDGIRPRPSRSKPGSESPVVHCAASRRGRTSRRGTGTGSSRAAPSPRRG